MCIIIVTQHYYQLVRFSWWIDENIVHLQTVQIPILDIVVVPILVLSTSNSSLFWCLVVIQVVVDFCKYNYYLYIIFHNGKLVRWLLGYTQFWNTHCIQYWKFEGNGGWVIVHRHWLKSLLSHIHVSDKK